MASAANSGNQRKAWLREGAAEARMPPILHRACALRYALIGAREPLGQVARGLFGSAAVKRHQRRRHARSSDDARAPPVLRDGGDLNQVRTSANGFFEAMNGCGHVFDGELWMFGSVCIVRRTAKRSSETTDEGASTIESRGLFGHDDPRKKFGVSVAPQEMHGSSTAFAQHGFSIRLDWLGTAHYA